MRRERSALQPDLGELTLKTLQGRSEHPRMRVEDACRPCPERRSCRPRLQRLPPSACRPRPILQTCPSLLSIRHLRITSESFTPSAGEQQPHARDVLEENAGLDRGRAAVAADGQHHRHRLRGSGQVGDRAFAATPLGVFPTPIGVPTTMGVVVSISETVNGFSRPPLPLPREGPVQAPAGPRRGPASASRVR